MNTATHARGIVHHNTAYHGRPSGGRIGTEGPAIRAQQFVGSHADYPGSESCLQTIIGDTVILPVLARDNKYGICNRLTRQTCSRRTKRDRQPVARRSGKKFRHLRLVV